MSHRNVLVWVLLLGLFVSPSANAWARSRLAPADEYFGRAKMSPLEITNRIRDGERGRIGFGGLKLTQGALEDWTAKYPLDPWIAPREYRLARLFAHFNSHDGYLEAVHCKAFLHRHFPSSRYR